MNKLRPKESASLLSVPSEGGRNGATAPHKQAGAVIQWGNVEKPAAASSKAPLCGLFCHIRQPRAQGGSQGCRAPGRPQKSCPFCFWPNLPPLHPQGRLLMKCQHAQRQGCKPGCLSFSSL